MAGTRKYDHDEAVARYIAGESTSAIAAAYGVRPEAIRKLLARRGVPRRKAGVEAKGVAAYHGTETGYTQYSCRCDDCRRAARESQQRRRERRMVPCEGCGKPRLHPNDTGNAPKGRYRKRLGMLCLDCIRAGKTPVQHGTIGGYSRGCRCDDCRKAIAAHNRERKRRRLAEGWQPRVHNASGYRNGCRCAVCHDAWNKYLRDRRRRKVAA